MAPKTTTWEPVASPYRRFLKIAAASLASDDFSTSGSVFAWNGNVPA